MNGEPLSRAIVVTNPEGLHVRPVAMFGSLAQKFQSDVAVVKNGNRFDGKSPLDLLGLGALPGTKLVLEIRGPDQDEAMKALGELLERLAAKQSAVPGGGD
jgi:phosphocarrier protein